MGGRFITIGAAVAFLAVAAGAFGAHGLRARLEPALLEVFETGARYAMYHGLALVLVGLLATRRPAPSRALEVAGWAFLAGVALFSGSLALLALTGVRKLGMITPFGGASFLVGWVALAVAGWQAPPGEEASR